MASNERASGGFASVRNARPIVLACLTSQNVKPELKLFQGMEFVIFLFNFLGGSQNQWRCLKLSIVFHLSRTVVNMTFDITVCND